MGKMAEINTDSTGRPDFLYTFVIGDDKIGPFDRIFEWQDFLYTRKKGEMSAGKMVDVVLCCKSKWIVVSWELSTVTLVAVSYCVVKERTVGC